MQRSGIPPKFPVPFASSAGPSYIRSIPTAPTGVTGQASLQLGFPPDNFNPVAAGGVPPFGSDFNGILNQITAWNQWVQAGGGVPYYDGTFALAVGGYPAGAFLQAANLPGNFWISLVDNNTVNPDAGPSSNWFAFPAALQQNTVFYINGGTGNDSYDGTSPTFVSGTTGPWATLQKAQNTIKKFNLNGFNFTINVADGSYAPLTLAQMSGSGAVNWVGDAVNPDACIISASGLNRSAVLGQNCGNAHTFVGFNVNASGTYSGGDAICGFNISGTGSSVVLQNITWGSCQGAHLGATQGAVVGYGGAMKIIGGCGGNAQMGGAHIFASANSQVVNVSGNQPALNVPTGTIPFNLAFIAAQVLSYTQITYSGITGSTNVGGAKFLVTQNSIMATGGQPLSYYPGSTAGTQSNGGLYL